MSPGCCKQNHRFISQLKYLWTPDLSNWFCRSRNNQDCLCKLHMCSCAQAITVHEAQTCVTVWNLNVPCVPVYDCVFTTFFKERVCECALRCHQYSRGWVCSMLRNSKSREGAHKRPPELTIVMNYGRALSLDTTTTSKNMAAVCKAMCNKHKRSWKLK